MWPLTQMVMGPLVTGLVGGRVIALILSAYVGVKEGLGTVYRAFLRLSESWEGGGRTSRAKVSVSSVCVMCVCGGGGG